MTENIFGGVEDTLFIPLAARVEISEKYPHYFFDEKALSFKNNIRVKEITEKSSQYSMIASVSRYFVMDKIVGEFIDKNKNPNVISLGCGLETMAWRIEKDAQFYEIDFPSVIEKRREILGSKENETLIGSDLNDLSWSENIDCTKPVIFVAAGVFQYFKERDVLTLIGKLQKIFSNAEILFDATNEAGINYAQNYVKKTGNKIAMMYFYVNNPDEFAHKTNTQLLLARGFFSEARKELKGKLNLYTRIAMKIADEKKRTIILNLKL